MEWRLSSRWKPRPEDAFAWGSQSASRILSPSIARQADRLIAVVVLPTPPFWFTTPRILPMAFKTNGSSRKRVAGFAVENSDELWKAAGQPSTEWLQLFPNQRLARMHGF